MPKDMKDCKRVINCNELVAEACEQARLDDDHRDGLLALVEDVEVDDARDGDESLDRICDAVDVDLHEVSVAQRPLLPSAALEQFDRLAVEQCVGGQQALAVGGRRVG